MPSSRDLPNSGTEPRSPASQVDSLSSELPGKSKNSGVGCHFLLQGIFPTQGSNLGLLNCKQILYHLSHQGSPTTKNKKKMKRKERKPRFYPLKKFQ